MNQQDLDRARVQEYADYFEFLNRLPDKTQEELDKAQTQLDAARTHYFDTYGGEQSVSSTNVKGMTGQETAMVLAGTVTGTGASILASKMLQNAPKIVKGVGEIFASGFGVAVGEGGTKLAFDTLEDTKSNFQENLDAAFGRGGEAAAWDMAFNTILKPAGYGIGKFFPGKEKKQIRETKKFLEEIGGKSSARLETDNAIIDWAEAFISDAFGAGKLKDVRETNYKAMRDSLFGIASRVSNNLKLTLRDGVLGGEVLDLLTGQSKLYRGLASERYGNLDSMLVDEVKVVNQSIPSNILDVDGNAIVKDIAVEVVDDAKHVSTATLKKVAQEQKELLGEIKGIGGDSVYDKIMSMGDKISFKAANELSTTFGDIAFGATQVGSKSAKTSGRYKNLGGLLSESMDESAKLYGPEFLVAYKATKKFVEKNKKIFENDIMVKLTTGNIDSVADEVFKNPETTQAFLNSLERYKKISAMTDDAARLSDAQVDAVANAARANWLSKNLLYKGLSEENKKISIKELSSALQNQADPNYFVVRKLFSDTQIKDLEAIYKNIDRVQGGAQAVGQFALQIAQASIGLNLMTGFTGDAVPTGTQASVILAPMALSILMTNPKSLKFFKGATKALVEGNVQKATSLGFRAMTINEKDIQNLAEAQEEINNQ
jgi:hypothetical protein